MLIPRLEHQHLLVACNCLFNIFTSYHAYMDTALPSNYNLRTSCAVVTWNSLNMEINSIVVLIVLIIVLILFAHTQIIQPLYSHSFMMETQDEWKNQYQYNHHQHWDHNCVNKLPHITSLWHLRLWWTGPKIFVAKA